MMTDKWEISLVNEVFFVTLQPVFDFYLRK